MFRFSIITVCLNEASNIRKTCESICSQTFRDFEWVVIDGGSTDGTLNVLEEYRDRISILISESDDGIYDAMNKGVRLATGKHLLFLNGGDYFADVDALKAVSAAPDRDILYGDMCCLPEDGQLMRKTYPDILPQSFLLKNKLPHQASFFRRELFCKYGNYDTRFKISADYDLFVRFLVVHKASYFHIPRVLSIFKLDGISGHKMNMFLHKLDNHQIRKKYFRQYRYSLKRWRMDLAIKSVSHTSG